MNDPEVMRCAVQSCYNSSDRTGSAVSYFHFPTDEETAILWKIKCDRNDSWDFSQAFICSAHFSNDDYQSLAPGIKQLHPLAVPSRNLRPTWDFSDGGSTSIEGMPTVKILSNIEGNQYVTLETLCEVASSSAIIDNSQEYTIQLEQSANEFHDEDYVPTNEVETVKTKSTSKRNRGKFCVVPTCVARTTTTSHYLPKNRLQFRKVWIQKIFFDDLKLNPTRCVCRRHFTENDYLDSMRLRYEAIPSQNLPKCRSEVLLARRKLALDLKYRKDHKSFQELLAIDPEFLALYVQYVEEMRLIDPEIAEQPPILRRRGELVGPGEPVKLGLSEKKQSLREKAEGKARAKLTKLIAKSANKKILLEKRQKKRKEFREKFALKDSEPLENQAPAEPAADVFENAALNFSDKIQIITEDPEKKTKYKVIVKKLVTKGEEGSSGVNQLAQDKPKAIALANKVIKKINFSKSNRVKFVTVDNVIKREVEKYSSRASLSKQIHQRQNESGSELGNQSDGVADFENPPDTFDDDEVYIDALDGEVVPEDPLISNKIITAESVPLPEKENFNELAARLRSLPENEARALVKEKMDAYRDTFKKQVSLIRNLLNAKRKADNNMKALTRSLVSSLRDQYWRFQYRK